MKKNYFRLWIIGIILALGINQLGLHIRINEIEDKAGLVDSVRIEDGLKYYYVGNKVFIKRQP